MTVDQDDSTYSYNEENISMNYDCGSEWFLDLPICCNNVIHSSVPHSLQWSTIPDALIQIIPVSGLRDPVDYFQL